MNKKILQHKIIQKHETKLKADFFRLGITFKFLILN